MSEEKEPWVASFSDVTDKHIADLEEARGHIDLARGFLLDIVEEGEALPPLPERDTDFVTPREVVLRYVLPLKMRRSAPGSFEQELSAFFVHADMLVRGSYAEATTSAFRDRYAYLFEKPTTPEAEFLPARRAWVYYLHWAVAFPDVDTEHTWRTQVEAELQTLYDEHMARCGWTHVPLPLEPQLALRLSTQWEAPIWIFCQHEDVGE